jgi:hypothetical protein
METFRKPIQGWKAAAGGPGGGRSASGLGVRSPDIPSKLS